MTHGDDMTELESALLVPVPAADLVTGPHRARLDFSAKDGVPAHLTVLYPFLPPHLIGPGELADLARLFAGFPAFVFTLDRIGWFGDAVAWLGPADETPFRALTALVCTAYPEYPPYGGAHQDVVPHLTIGHLGSPDALRAAADDISQSLPITANAAEVTLMTGPRAAGRTSPAPWATVATFPLDASRGSTRPALA